MSKNMNRSFLVAAALFLSGGAIAMAADAAPPSGTTGAPGVGPNSTTDCSAISTNSQGGGAGEVAPAAPATGTPVQSGDTH